MYGAMSKPRSSFRNRQTSAIRSFFTKAQSSPPTPTYGSYTASGKRSTSASITALDMVVLASGRPAAPGSTGSGARSMSLWGWSWIFFWRSMIASSTCSGRGGQPGT